MSRMHAYLQISIHYLLRIYYDCLSRVLMPEIFSNLMNPWSCLIKSKATSMPPNMEKNQFCRKSTNSH